MMKLHFVFTILSLLFSTRSYCQIDLSALGTAHTEVFNTLSETPENSIVSPAVLPSDWLIYNDGFDEYKVSNGSSTSTDIYSYGSVGDADRSLGSFRTASFQELYFGASFHNNTGNDIYFLEISFTVEQWRRGGDWADALIFEISHDATDLTNGTFDEIPDGTTTAIYDGSPATLDGNQITNQTRVSIVYPCNLAPGEIFFLRWRDDNTAFDDAGLGVDDFSITPHQVVHYYDNNTLYTDLYSWGINTDGSGARPTDFTAPDQYFHFKNNTVTLDQPWDLSDGVDTNVVVNETTTLVLQSEFVIAKFILDASSVLSIEGTNTLALQEVDALSVIDFKYGSTNPALISFDSCGILSLNSGPAYRFNSDLYVKNRVDVLSNVYAYVPESVTITGGVNVFSDSEVECEKYSSVSFNTLDLNSIVTYSGTGLLFEAEDTIYNQDYGILKMRGKRTHVLGEDIVTNNYVELLENNTLNGTGGLDFSDHQLTGPGNFWAHNDAIMLVRDSMGVQGSIKMTGEIHILEDVQIGYIGNNVKYSGNPYLDADRLIAIGNAGPPDLIITEDFYVSGYVQPYGGNIDLRGKVIYLDPTAALSENTGYTVYGDSGYVEFTETFGTLVNNPGNLGLQVTSDQALGLTTIRRGHQIQTDGTNESIRRYFDIHPATNSSLNATLRMYYVDDAYLLNSLDETTFELFQSLDTGRTWQEKVTSVNNASSDYVELSGISNFSRWTIASSNSPLPVQLINFQAVAMSHETHIVWATLSEHNCSHFLLLKSTDGIHYVELENIPGSGTVNYENSYSFSDPEISFPVTYYKLVQVDFDGKERAYDPVYVQRETGHSIIYDQNAKRIRINIPEGEQAVLYNSNGQHVRTFSSGVYSCEGLTNGVYLVSYKNYKVKFSKWE